MSFAMSHSIRSKLIRLLQSITGSDFISLENLYDMYAKRFPEDYKGKHLLHSLAFSNEAPSNEDMAELIQHLVSHKKL